MGGGDGVEEQVGFRGGPDDGAVAVGAVAQDWARDVGSVPMQVFSIVSTGAEA